MSSTHVAEAASPAQDTATSKRKRTPNCIPCRERHIKCGKERPVCSSCSSARYSRTCSYESKRGFRFRPTLAPCQPGDLGSFAASPGSRRKAHVQDQPSPSRYAPGEAQSSAQTHSPAESHSYGVRLSNHEEQITQDLFSPTSHAQPLSDGVECDIFTFYANKIGVWIDIGSPSHYFQKRVPQLAMTNSLLFYACMSCSSEIMALRGEVDKSLEEFYSSKVLEILIPVLSSNEATSSNEALLATTVILRMSEQFLEIDNDSRRHLFGAASLFKSNIRWSLREVDLATAAFWTHLRESIRVSFLHETASGIFIPNVVEDDALLTHSSRSEETWTNHITYLLLQVIQFCWGKQWSILEHTRLATAVREWETSLPIAFRPWCFSKSEAGLFPRIQCFDSWHVVAWQFYYVAMIMLAVLHIEQGPRSGLLDTRRRMEYEIVVPTQMLCGLCVNSTDNVGNTLNGSHLITWAGQYLGSPEQQHVLEKFLTKFSHETQWPTYRSLERLRSRWEVSKSS